MKISRELGYGFSDSTLWCEKKKYPEGNWYKAYPVKKKEHFDHEKQN